MVLPAPPAHASPAEPRWLDRLVVAIELSAQGVLTLVDHAAPARLREAYLRLRARDPATEVVVDVRKLADLPPGATAILALGPTSGGEDLDWLNLNRPVVSDRRLSVVLWCEDGAADVLAQRAPDFFDWISARVDCPPAPTAHAVADVRRAICARASGIAWDGPGLEETLAAVRPGRPIRRVVVASYQSMIDALTSRDPGWLFLEGIDTEFHLRRLRWAMAETRRRVIVFRRAFDETAPGWWTVHARHASIVEAVSSLAEAGGSGRLAALTELDPDACAYARFALRRGIQAARLEALLAIVSDPRATLQCFAQLSGWTEAEVLVEDAPQGALAATRQAIEREAARHARDEDPIVAALRSSPSEPVQWVELGAAVAQAGDFEVTARSLTRAMGMLPNNEDSPLSARLHTLLGQARHRAGDIASARVDLERAYSLALGSGDATSIAAAVVALAHVLLLQGEPLRARECLESALSAGAELGGETEATALMLEMLAMMLMVQGDSAGARLHLERALSIKRIVYATEDHPAVADTLEGLGRVLEMQGDGEGARAHLARSLDIRERLLGRDHPTVATTLRDLGAVHRAMGNLSSARALLDRALAMQRIVLGADDHPGIARTLVELARVLAAGGDLDGAQAMLERALAIQQKASGDDDPLAGPGIQRVLADVLVAKGDLVGARGHLERALATLRTSSEHGNLLVSLAIAPMRRELERVQEMQRAPQRAD